MTVYFEESKSEGDVPEPPTAKKRESVSKSKSVNPNGGQVVTVTDGENTHDVEFTDKGIYIVRHGDPTHEVIAEIDLASAAARLVSAFVYDDPE